MKDQQTIDRELDEYIARFLKAPNINELDVFLTTLFGAINQLRAENQRLQKEQGLMQ